MVDSITRRPKKWPVFCHYVCLEAIWIRPFTAGKRWKQQSDQYNLNNNTKVDDAIVITPNRLIDDEHKFRSKGFWVAAVLTVVSVGILIKLGLWQLDRGNEKLSYEQQLLGVSSAVKDLELVISDWQRGNTVDLTRQIWNGQRSTSLWQRKAVWSSLLDNQINQGVSLVMWFTCWVIFSRKA